MEQKHLNAAELENAITVPSCGIRIKDAPVYKNGKYAKELSKELITSDCIRERIKYMARHIGKMMSGEVTCLVILKGGIVFASDLIRALEEESNLRVKLEFATASSYLDSDKPIQEVVVTGLNHLPAKNILIIEDIVDTGSTLFKLQKMIKAMGKKAATCVLLKKERHRDNEPKIDFLGFNIPDEFVVGYGLDYAGKFRALPYIAVVRV